MPEPANQQAPSATQLRNYLIQSLTHDQLKTLTVWLGLEATERNCDEIFKLGKTLLFWGESNPQGKASN